ncbi:MAG: NUDIX hydrolase [Bacteriovoracaceae bacterium]
MEKTVYKGNILKVTEEEIDGIVWEKVYLPSGVIVFPITDDGKIMLIKEKRPHETPNVRIKPVSGILEPEKGTPEENAQREMQEEIGYKAREMKEILVLKGTGTVTHLQYFFVARGLTHSKLPNPDGDIIEAIIEYTPDELRRALEKEEIKWSMSTLGLFRLLDSLG